MQSCRWYHNNNMETIAVTLYSIQNYYFLSHFLHHIIYIHKSNYNFSESLTVKFKEQVITTITVEIQNVIKVD